MGIFQNIQEEIVRRLQADDALSRLKILREDRKDIASEINIALARVGLFVLVRTPQAAARDQSPGPFCELTLDVQVVENVPINRAASGTGLVGGDVAERIAWLLHAPNRAQTRTVFLLLLKAVEPAEADGALAWNVRLTTTGSLGQGLPQT